MHRFAHTLFKLTPIPQPSTFHCRSHFTVHAFGNWSGFRSRHTTPLFKPASQPQDDTAEFQHSELEDDHSEEQAVSPENVTVIQTKREAAAVIDILHTLPEETLVAWDTETTDVDPTVQTPVGNGRVICATAYAGHDIDFGTGSRLFVDCLDGEKDLLQTFKPYFESENRKKVWHHYAFDRHVLQNGGIRVGGFGGDTMHMARLVDTSLRRYALDELCGHFLQGQRKTGMKDRFGFRQKLKSGLESKSLSLPCTLDLQRGEQRLEWIDYATLDAELTYRLCHLLKNMLECTKIEGSNSPKGLTDRFDNLYEVYRSVMVPFGELLTDMERTGFKVDVNLLQQAEKRAREDEKRLEHRFREWAMGICEDAKYMNVHSDLQKKQLFFSPCTNSKDKSQKTPREKAFTIELTGIQKDLYLEELKNSNIEGDRALYEKYVSQKWAKKKVKRQIVLRGLGKTNREKTESGWPSCSAKAMKRLAGSPRADPPVYGDPELPEMCLAIDDLISATAISTLASTFIVPLQQWPGEDGRIHASLNLNTETGRISSRRPNLQNQPSLEKDIYQVRKAFACETGNSLIVADYGQLELRLLAHITNCESMIEAFAAGGDFHSRTALSMFDDVRRGVERGECLLEREAGKRDTPLLKEMFAVERRKAKTLNFSIAYGKTVQGLAKDWNVSVEEAEDTLTLWYKERQEVLNWQRQCRQFARDHKFVETILGRRRHLPNVESLDYSKRGHALRAAINAPLQGSAADLVMAAMIKLHNNSVLRTLGWKLILQVHDEIIMEGPEESAHVALPIVVEEMRNPIDVALKVDLDVDAKCAKTWYEAK